MSTNQNDNNDDGDNGNGVPPPFPNLRSRLAASAKLTIAKHQSEKIWRDFERDNGPRAEYHTRILYGHSTLIPVDHIIDDHTFTNTRLHINPVGLTNLQDSIDLEGLKVPIIVAAAASPGFYHVRAGFRRTLAVRNLGWHDIPATILPSDMPPSEEHWINIIENASREKLSTYELALAARNMRDKFGTSISEFARKTCHPPSYINDLLGCLERLPEEVLNSWAYNDRVPFSIYVKLSVMTPLEAIRNLRLWRGQHRIDDAATLATKALDRRRVRNHENDKILTVKGIERTQRLMVAIQTSTLAPDTKRLAVEIVEYLQGCRKRVDGIIHDGWRLPPAPPTEDLEFEMMMEAKIRQLQKENTGDTTPRRNDEDNL